MASDDADASRASLTAPSGHYCGSEENSFPSCSHAGDDTSDDDEGEGTRSPSPTSASASAIDRGDLILLPAFISHVTTADTSGIGRWPAFQTAPFGSTTRRLRLRAIFKMSNRETGEVFDSAPANPGPRGKGGGR